RMFVTGLEGPLLVEAVEDRSTACLERAHRIAFAEREPKGAGIDAEVRSVERNGVPRGDEVDRLRPKGLPQLRERDAQARPRRFGEHIGPEARGEPAAPVRTRVERKEREHRPRPLRGWGRELRAIRAQLHTTCEPDLQHAINCRPPRPARATPPSPFTRAER